jgi:hypothetical protein
MQFSKLAFDLMIRDSFKLLFCGEMQINWALWQDSGWQCNSFEFPSSANGNEQTSEIEGDFTQATEEKSIR